MNSEGTIYSGNRVSKNCRIVSEEIVEELTLLYFNETRDTFILVEMLHGNYFNAEFLGLTYASDVPDGLMARLTLSDVTEYICEEIKYEIT